MSRGRAEHDLDLDPTEPWTCVYLPGRGSTHPKEQPRQGQCVILRALGGGGAVSKWRTSPQLRRPRGRAGAGWKSPEGRFSLWPWKSFLAELLCEGRSR